MAAVLARCTPLGAIHLHRLIVLSSSALRRWHGWVLGRGEALRSGGQSERRNSTWLQVDVLHRLPGIAKNTWQTTVVAVAVEVFGAHAHVCLSGVPSTNPPTPLTPERFFAR
uniref:Putative secreted protein n=1 Tax=Ixodes ricinus TaxID=34613 RepID=A0A6B0UJN5_IXORI